MVNLSPSVSENVSHRETLTSPKSIQRADVEKGNLKSSWSTNCYSVNTWVKAGLVVGTTALIYGVVKTCGYFSGLFQSDHYRHGAQTEKGVMRGHRQETDASTAVQQNQKTADPQTGHYDAFSLRERTNPVFEELEISDVNVPKDPRLLQAPIVQNPVQDREIIVEHPLNLSLRHVFDDADGDFLSLSVRLSTGDPLPSWMSFSSFPFFLGSYNTPDLARDVIVRGATAFVVDDPSGLQIIDIGDWSLSGTPSSSSDIGSYNITLTAADGVDRIEESFTLAITNAIPTVVIPIPDQSVRVGEAFSFQFNSVTFNDADGQTLSYTATLADNSALPGWLSFDSTNRTFSGTPISGDQAALSVKVTADDGFGGVIEDIFFLTVINRVPSLDNSIPDQSIVIGQSYLYQFPDNTFSDSDLDTLTYTATLENGDALPAWLTFNSGTRTFSGIPATEDQGILTITVTASDFNGGSVTDTFGLAVESSSANLPPRLVLPIPNQLANINQLFIYQMPGNTFEDLDGDPLNYRASQSNEDSLPGWLNFDDASRTFTGTPSQEEVGEIEILVTATDPQGLAEIDTFTIVVVDNVNYASVVSNPIPKQTADIGKEFRFTIPDNTFSDPNGDPLSYSVSILPGWLKFDPNTRTFSGTPERGDTNPLSDRDHVIEITATDGQLTTSTTFIVSVIGTSYLELAFKIGAPLLSVLGAAYGGYKKRGAFINQCNKRRYMKPKEMILAHRQVSNSVVVGLRNKTCFLLVVLHDKIITGSNDDKSSC